MENYTYEIITTPSDIKMVVRSDGAWIPPDPTNSDYQAYLKSLEKPSVKKPAPLEEVPAE